MIAYVSQKTSDDTAIFISHGCPQKISPDGNKDSIPHPTRDSVDSKLSYPREQSTHLKSTLF